MIISLTSSLLANAAIPSQPGWVDGAVHVLSSPLLAPILLAVGVLGLLIEIKTPHFGLFGLIGLLSLAAFFGSRYLVGMAGLEVFILLGIGLVAMLVEVFVVPGFGFAGIISIVTIGAGVFLALIGSLPTWDDIARALGILAVTVGLVLAAIYGIVRHLPTSKRWRGIFLQAAHAREDGYVSAASRPELVGKEGVAATDLHPSGAALVGDERLDVVSEAGFVPKGARVTVVRSEGYRLVVRPAAG